MEPLSSVQINLEPNDSQRLSNFCGQYDQHLRQIERYLGIQISNRGNLFKLTGTKETLEIANSILPTIYANISAKKLLTLEELHLQLKELTLLKTAASDTFQSEQYGPLNEGVEASEPLVIKTRKLKVKPRGRHQQDYVHKITQGDVCFGIGPAGTGKTYLAVACAINALLEDRVERIVLVCPAVEAGEKLGFLPGDMTQKVDPYLRPLYDALYQMLGTEYTERLIDRNLIEIAPLAFMRGRTLSNDFVIFDESQNSTKEQMQMLLTRIGVGSSVVVTGDITQIDLPEGTYSGLLEASKVLVGIDGIHFCYFNSSDIIRHSVVQRIVDAYADHRDQGK